MLAPKRRGNSGGIFTWLPLLIIPVLVYSLVLALPGTGDDFWRATRVTFVMLSGDQWRMSYGDIFLVVSLIFLFVETVRATGHGSSTTLNHALSMAVFVVALILFIGVKGYATTAFFSIVIMTGIDVLAGFIITTVAARRDFGFSAD